MHREPSDDPRVRRTQRHLEEALLSLLEERDLSSITVRDITKAADLNRATLYLHYRDKDDLARQVLDALFEELVAGVREFIDAHTTISPEAPPEVLVKVFRRMRERPQLYLRLLSDVAPGSFAARYAQFSEEEALRHWADLNVPVGEHEAPSDFRMRFATSATIGVMLWWLQRGTVEDPETVAGWLWELQRPIWFGHGTHLER